MIIQESFACQNNGNYKLTCQCENTILSVFTLLHSTTCNTLLIQINLKLIQISKTRGEESLVEGRTPAPQLAMALLGKLYQYIVISCTTRLNTIILYGTLLWYLCFECLQFCISSINTNLTCRRLFIYFKIKP